jgi:uncharacterized surface protein with fasciclin (FAS1) repeats
MRSVLGPFSIRRAIGGLTLALAMTVAPGPLPASPAGAESADVVDTAAAAGQFTTLVAAVRAAGLVDTLKGPGPFTVFAPTDAAFEQLPPGTLDALLQDSDRLRAILAYHVVPGTVMAADIADGQAAATVQGAPITFTTTDGVRVNDAAVVQPDLAVSNGVIHVIDTVLLPPGM